MKTILRCQACLMIFLVSAIFSFHQVIAVDGSCPADPCVSYFHDKICRPWLAESEEIESNFQRASSGLREEAQRLCDRLDWSESAEKSIFDQINDTTNGGLKFEELQHWINNDLFESIKENVPTNLNDCYEWSQKLMNLVFRGLFYSIEQNQVTECSNCGLYDIPCLNEIGPHTSELLFDEISFDSETESCKDLRPNWCKNARTNKFDWFKKLCEKEGSKVGERFCCKTCESIADIV